jgi:alpha-glucosidase
MATVPDYVKQFLQTLPRSWDDSRMVDGYPGKYAVIARRAGRYMVHRRHQRGTMPTKH